jgi:hypothetical protein
MNTRTATKHDAAQREPSCPRGEIVGGASSNASYTKKNCSPPDHQAAMKRRQLESRP